MTKRILTILFILFFLQSCSWITDFYVLNSSKNPIVVTFKQPKAPETTLYLEKLKAENPELYKKLKPKPCPLERDIENGKYPEVCDKNLENCRILSPEEYRFNKDECSIELTLEKNQAVKIFSICCSYTGVSEDKQSNKKSSQHAEEDTFTLTIKSASGLIQYKGIELMKAFKKKENTKYVLEYK